MVKGKKDPIDQFTQELQERIKAEEREKYSSRVIEEFERPNNISIMKKPDSKARITGPCGDTVEIFLKIDNGKIKKATFMTDGCGATIACGSMITKMIENKKIGDATQITKNDLINALDGLPDENDHCAELVIYTLTEAIENYDKNKKS
jgi:nitrogen fixation NifU-like protein